YGNNQQRQNFLRLQNQLLRLRKINDMPPNPRTFQKSVIPSFKLWNQIQILQLWIIDFRFNTLSAILKYLICYWLSINTFIDFKNINPINFCNRLNNY